MRTFADYIAAARREPPGAGARVMPDPVAVSRATAAALRCRRDEVTVLVTTEPPAARDVVAYRIDRRRGTCERTAALIDGCLPGFPPGSECPP